jgi:hypothetical protein
MAGIGPIRDPGLLIKLEKMIASDVNSFRLVRKTGRGGWPELDEGEIRKI